MTNLSDKYPAIEGGGGLDTVEVTSGSNIEDGKCYIVNSASQLDLSLPSTMAQGFHFAVVNVDAGYRIMSNASATMQKVIKNARESRESSSSNVSIFEDTTLSGYAEFYCTTANSILSEVSEGNGIPKTANYFGDQSDGALNTSGDETLTSTEDGDMVVKQYSDVTINTGDTLTVQNRCRGLALFIDGDLTVDGTISMTAKGCHANPAESTTSSDTPVAPSDGSGVGSDGIRIPFKTESGTDSLASAEFGGCGNALVNLADSFPSLDSDGNILQIARTGGDGGATPGNYSNGNTGSSSSNSCGGGGSGGDSYNTSEDAGSGASGTCFSGGSGGGGCYAYSPSATSAESYGGAGGDGHSYSSRKGGGGAGNPGGDYSDPSNPAEDGTGGLLLIICSGTITINSGGKIESNGKDGGDSDPYGGGGGGSGGGAIALIYKTAYSNDGTVEASGGNYGNGDGSYHGGAGGSGSIQTLQVI